MIFLTPKQNQQRNAVILVLDFAILKDVLKEFTDEDEINGIWRGILHDYTLKLTCLTEHATCFWTIDQIHRFTNDEVEFFKRMLSNWEFIELQSNQPVFSLAQLLKTERNFKQVTFVSSLVPSLSPVILIDAQEWLWEAEFVLGPDTESGMYMFALRMSEIDELKSISWQDPRLFIRVTELSRAKGKLSQPVFFWKQLRTLGDLEHYYQFFAALAGINPKYNGFDGFHTWEAINQITDGMSLLHCERFLKAQIKDIEDQKDKLRQKISQYEEISYSEDSAPKDNTRMIDNSDDYPEQIKIKAQNHGDTETREIQISKPSQNRTSKAPKLEKNNKNDLNQENTD